jgi:tetratricopeptide (TPR) repeat protein
VFGLVSAAFSRRHLQGQPGEAQAFVENARARFGRLELFPVVLRYCARDAKEYTSAMAVVRELALRSPERLTGGHWALFRQKETFGPVPTDLPDENAWFRPALPAGTLVDVTSRLEVLGELREPSPVALAALRELAPHNVALARFAASRLPNTKRSAADLAAVYGPLAEFDVGLMASLADAAWYDPAGFRERQGALCEVVPERCFILGYRLAELGFADEAAVAYQKGFDRALDRVLAANSSRWLVDYYLDHGQAKKAEAVAREAAAVYSSGGLFVMARLAERTGRLAEAEEHYRRILDRYDHPEELTGFYYRMARVEKKAAYEPKLRDALARALPSGLESLDRATLPRPPVDGVVVRSANDNTKRFGMAYGNVIVGVDGFRVRDRHAYQVLVALSQSPRMTLVVWRGSSYDDVEVDLWDRQLRVELADQAAKP